MQAEVISVGTELLLGAIQDTNATAIAQALRDIGVDLLFRTTVGDNEHRIAAVVDHALDRAALIVITGGLGPTVDDVTREGISRATGRALTFNQDLYNQISERFRQYGVSMSENNRRQAFVPEGSIPIENPVGSAPIFILETERGAIMVLPGVPREMSYLLEHKLIPWIKAQMDSPSIITSLTLRTAGYGESHIDSQIDDLMRLSNPTVGLAAHAGQVDIRVTAKSSSLEAARELIAPVAADLRTRLGSIIYGEDQETIENATLSLLNKQGLTSSWIITGVEANFRQRLETACHDLAMAFPPVDGFADISSIPVESESAIESIASAAAQWVRDKYSTDFGVAILTRHLDDVRFEGAIGVSSIHGHDWRPRRWTQDYPDATTWLVTYAFATLRRQALKILKADTE